MPSGAHAAPSRTSVALPCVARCLARACRPPCLRAMIPPAARPAAHVPGPARAVEDRRTTLMIKNIPNKYTQKMLLQTMDEQFRGGYDFFYLPIDFKNKCNVGYAFINLVRCESGRALACGHAPLGVPGVLAGARVLRFVWGALRGRSASWRWNTLESFWGALPAVSEPAFVLGPWLSGRLWRPDVCRGRTAPRSVFASAAAAAACGPAIPAPLGAGAGAPEPTARARARRWTPAGSRRSCSASTPRSGRSSTARRCATSATRASRASRRWSRTSRTAASCTRTSAAGPCSSTSTARSPATRSPSPSGPTCARPRPARPGHFLVERLW